MISRKMNCQKQLYSLQNNILRGNIEEFVFYDHLPYKFTRRAFAEKEKSQQRFESTVKCLPLAFFVTNSGFQDIV